jgi:hypothetical protein
MKIWQSENRKSYFVWIGLCLFALFAHLLCLPRFPEVAVILTVNGLICAIGALIFVLGLGVSIRTEKEVNKFLALHKVTENIPVESFELEGRWLKSITLAGQTKNLERHPARQESSLVKIYFLTLSPNLVVPNAYVVVERDVLPTLGSRVKALR